MGRIGFALLFCVTLIFSLGLVMIFNTTAAELLDKSRGENVQASLFKQLSYGGAGIFFGFCFYQLGYQKLLDWSGVLLKIMILLLCLVFVPKIGVEINGAKRWLGFLGFTIQPSEFAKYIIPLYFIHYMQKRQTIDNLRSFIKMLLIFIFPIGLILLEPDNGGTIIILSTLVVLFFLYRIKASFWALPLSVVIILGTVVAYNMPHVHDRIRVYFHPELDLRGKGHQPYQAKIAIGSGQLFGKGLGESLQKLNYLPEARSDYIAAIFAEEFGFLGILVLLGLYMILSYLGFFIAGFAADKEGMILATIFTYLISFQTFLNLGVVSALLPSKGITLPFFSQGGTSLIVNMISIAVLLSIAKISKQTKSYLHTR